MLAGIAVAASIASLTVDAGRCERRNAPVAVELPPTLAARRLELRAPGLSPVPLQTDGRGRGIFVLPSLKKGERLRFEVHEAEGEPRAGVAVDRDDHGLVLRIGAARVLRYQAIGEAPSPEIPASAVRGGYLHPVFTPSGVLVTDDYHPKHRAHHGIWTAWTAAELEGRKISFWGSNDGRNDFVALQRVWSGTVAGGFSARHASMDLSPRPPKPVLDETWEVVLYRTHEANPPYFVFDLEWVDRAASDAPLVLPEYRYGGLGLRGHAAWDGVEKLHVLNSEGETDRMKAEGSRGRWIHLGGEVDGRRAGFAVLVHPGNFRAPQPFRVHPNEPFVCVAPAKAGGFAIEPGRPYVSRYRFVVADGPPDRELLDRLWNDYAEPPAAAVAGPD